VFEMGYEYSKDDGGSTLHSYGVGFKPSIGTKTLFGESVNSTISIPLFKMK